MKPLLEQDHYEVLEIPRNASPEEIERAYRLARETYADDSLAGYSVFGDGDAGALRERMELAYRVLTDRAARAEYDARMSAADTAHAAPLESVAAPAEADSGIEPFEEMDDEAGEFDGPRLRRSRMRRGLELEEIAKTTKINPAYLRYLEEERFPELPARVYVRGFVSAYAHSIGLDPHRVSSSYMKLYDERRRRGHGA